MKKYFIFPAIILALLSCANEKNKSENQNKNLVKSEVSYTIPDGFSQEALWIRYPAISPDGKTIAFSYKGDIWKVPATGGAAYPLTNEKSYEFMPVWSPDSKKIAFASDRAGNFDIYITFSSGGNSKRVTYHSSGDFPSSFSPDGKNIIFSSSRQDSPESILFPSMTMPELYEVEITGGNEKLVSTIPAMNAVYDKTGTKILYHDQKGYEDKWRKHHISSIARDIWLFDRTKTSWQKLTDFKGEDRNPLWNQDNSAFYYLSEKSGTFNIWKTTFANPKETTQMSDFKTHPVRFLSISDNGLMAFTWHGELFTIKEGGKPQKVAVAVPVETAEDEFKTDIISGNITGTDISPNGKEVVFIVRGEIFVTSTDMPFTRRITETPEEESFVSFSPDGRKILYSRERGGSWKIYETTIKRDDEKYFYMATEIEEKPLIELPENSFKPAYSPDGFKIAFLRERNELAVYDSRTKQIKTALPAEKNMSYIDGDINFSWSPDSRYLLTEFTDKDRWSPEIALVSADGTDDFINITNSGWEDILPAWTPDGNGAVFSSNRFGSLDIFAVFLNRKSIDLFRLNKEEFLVYKEKNKINPQKPEEKQEVTQTKIEKEGLEERIVRLTIDNGAFFNPVFSPDGERMFAINVQEKTFEIHQIEQREKKSKIIAVIPIIKGDRDSSDYIFMKPDKEQKNLYFTQGGRIIQIEIASGKQTLLPIAVEFSQDRIKEREYMFFHAWKTVKDKFYTSSLHNINWDLMRTEYEKMLPHISYGYDFSELLSEMLGELNASHTGCGYVYSPETGEFTASLGVVFDPSYQGSGVKIAEIPEFSPLKKAASQIISGTIIEKIDGLTIDNSTNFFKLLRRKAGKYVRLSLFQQETNKHWEETVKPVFFGMEMEIMYQRWIKREREMTEKLSKNRLGYIHIRGMNPNSFRKTFSDVLGKYNDKEGIVIDTRFNGGGWLHNELSILFGGKQYTRFSHREKAKYGGDPQDQWAKKSILLVGESNYSDAHMFPYAYKELKLGSIVGMPIPGTGTAVWWKTMIDKNFYFGIPQIGIIANNGKYLENQELTPDFIVENKPEKVSIGTDEQLEKAVEILLKQIDSEKSSSKQQ